MVRTNSGTSPLIKARNTTLFSYKPGFAFPSITSLLGLPNIKEELLSPLSRVVMQICFLFYCRITEVLNVKVSDHLKPDRVLCHGLKHSHSYIIYLPGLSDQICEAAIEDESIPLFPISYLKLYRDAVRIGINYNHKGGKNRRRLHTARYAFCKNVSRLVLDSDLAGLMRHKSKKTYLYYKS